MPLGEEKRFRVILGHKTVKRIFDESNIDFNDSEFDLYHGNTDVNKEIYWDF